MFFLRLLGSWSMLVAIVALVADVTKSMAMGTGFGFTSLGRQWFEHSPATLAAAQSAIERWVAPVAWDPVATFVLQTPTWVVFATLGALLFMAGRQRERVNIFMN